VAFLQEYRPHVFVAMPFGVREVEAPTATTPAVTIDFDEVYKRLIAPALRASGCESFRADEEVAAGDIRADMFFELATADFVVADISTLNANVFYELGIRQGVAERGVILIHESAAKRPFDIAPDRTLKYPRDPFLVPHPFGWEQTVEDAIAPLTVALRKIIAADRRGKSSPLYKELEGLRPPDIRTIKSARARYFDAVFGEIADRVRVARRRGLAGDILTLAEEAPNALYRSKLLLSAGRSLIDLRRYDLAQELLREVVERDPDDADAASLLGMALNRIGRGAEAEVQIQRLVARANGHPGANGALGRVLKDQWRLRWERAPTLDQRLDGARKCSEILARAMRRYLSVAAEDARTYYNGINALALAALLDHLGEDLSSMSPSAAELGPVVTMVARRAHLAAGQCETDEQRSEYVWSTATLGELAVLAGDRAAAVSFYRQACTTPGVTHFELDSMLDQLRMFEGLGFQSEIVAEVRALLAAALDESVGETTASGEVLFCSGHMIDTDDRDSTRFPRSKEQEVATWIANQLGKWNVREGDVAMCGGARGTDLLFAEACLQRGVAVQLFIPLDEAEFLGASVDLPNSNWRQRYFHVKGNRLTSIRYQPDEIGRPPPKADVFLRNNRWMLNTAWVQARTRDKMRVLLVWNGQSTGDGPGGTSHAAEIAKRYAGDVQIADPMLLGMA
jgi:tetratricopeptide (TPR) repeat protein